MGSTPSLVGHNRLQLFLNSPPDDRVVYLPGDLIQGDISLQNPYHAAGIDASISFTGLSRVRFKEKGRLYAPVHSHEDEFLGWWKTNLACTKRHDALVWNFNFCIPSEERATRSSHEGDFSNRAADALSPTLGHLTDKEGEDKYAAVTYILKASLSKPDSSHSYAGPTVCQIQLPFSPLCLETFRDCPPHVVSSSHPIPPYNLATTVFGRGENRRRRSLSNVFWTSMGPRLDTTVLTPKIAVAAQPLDIKLSFDHNLMPFAARQLPPVILETLSIELVSETRARIPNASPRDPQAKWTEITFCCKLDAASIPVEQRSGMLTRSKEHRWDANLLVPELNAGLPVTPSFVTPSLSHAHTLRVRGQMDIDTEKIQFNVEKPLIVLSQYSREDPLAFSSKSASMSESDYVEDETSAPPPYTEASSGAMTLPSYVNAITEKP
ncbi:MAG: hypothetical protein L6R35_004984 [Caloplaca aegaea]|nr:MAG: hypothetical protein L6R35_004984 [Caloplaca aegaea]